MTSDFSLVVHTAPANGGGPRIGGHAKVGGGIAGGDIHVSFGGGLR